MDELVQTWAALDWMACNQSLSDGALQQTVISGYSALNHNCANWYAVQ